jgi:hypothetical protein
LNGDIAMSAALALVSKLRIAADHRKDPFEFYLFHCAEEDLRESGLRYYWDGATRSNLASIIRQRALAFTTVTGRV